MRRRGRLTVHAMHGDRERPFCSAEALTLGSCTVGRRGRNGEGVARPHEPPSLNFGRFGQYCHPHGPYQVTCSSSSSLAVDDTGVFIAYPMHDQSRQVGSVVWLIAEQLSMSSGGSGERALDPGSLSSSDPNRSFMDRLNACCAPRTSSLPAYLH